MKDELISLCADLERNIDQRLIVYDERLERLQIEMSARIQQLTLRYPEDQDVRDLAHLGVGLRQTQRLLNGKLEAIRCDGDHLLEGLREEVRERLPGIRQKIENSESYEQAMLEIQRETHTGTKSFRDFFRGLMLWRESPEEHLEAQNPGSTKGN